MTIVLAARQPDDDVRPHAAVVPIAPSRLSVCCSSKSQCSTMPASSMTRFSCSSPQRPRTPGRFSASTRRFVSACRSLPVAVERRDSLHQLGARLHAAPFGFLDLAIDVVERLGHRLEQVFDRLLARVDVGGGLGAGSREARFGQMQERFVVRLEGVGAERAERFAQLPFGLLMCLLVRVDTLCVDRAFLVELGLQPRGGRPRRQPRDERAEHRTHDGAGGQRDDDGEVQGICSEYRTRFAIYRDTTNGSHASGSCSSAA